MIHIEQYGNLPAWAVRVNQKGDVLVFAPINGVGGEVWHIVDTVLRPTQEVSDEQ